MMVRCFFISISRLGDESRPAASAEPRSQTQNAGPSGRHSTLKVSGWAVYFSASGFSSSRKPIRSRKEMHAVLFHHHGMRSLAQFDQPLVGRILQLCEIAVREVARKVRVPFGVKQQVAR